MKLHLNMKSSVVALFCLGLAVLVSACNNQHSTFNNLANSDVVVGIRNGKPVTNDSAFAVSTVGIKIEATPGFFYTCTGTLISEWLVLTAAHCGFQDKTSAITVVLSTDLWDTSADKLFNVDKTIRPAAYAEAIAAKNSEEGAKYDIAIMKLSRPAPTNRVAKLLDSQAKQRLNNTQYAVGVGKDENDKTSGKLNLAILQRTLAIRGDEIFLDYPVFQGQGINSGDSGGPSYIKDGNDYLVSGIVTQQRVVPDTKEYLGAVYLNIVLYLDWIKRTSTELMNNK